MTLHDILNKGPKRVRHTTVQEVPVEMEWDKAAEKRFQSLAVKEAMETLSASELVELEQLTIARRKHTAPSVSAQ